MADHFDWTNLADAAAVNRRAPLVVRRGAEGYVLWRDATGKVHGEQERCPHEAEADEACPECLLVEARALRLREADGRIWMQVEDADGCYAAAG